MAEEYVFGIINVFVTVFQNYRLGLWTDRHTDGHGYIESAVDADKE